MNYKSVLVFIIMAIGAAFPAINTGKIVSLKYCFETYQIDTNEAYDNCDKGIIKVKFLDNTKIQRLVWFEMNNNESNGKLLMSILLTAKSTSQDVTIYYDTGANWFGTGGKIFSIEPK